MWSGVNTEKHLTLRLSKHKGVGTVNYFRYSGTTNTHPRKETHTHYTAVTSMQEILAILVRFLEKDDAALKGWRDKNRR